MPSSFKVNDMLRNCTYIGALGGTHGIHGQDTPPGSQLRFQLHDADRLRCAAASASAACQCTEVSVQIGGECEGR
jgi:hypothetical protein